MTKSFHGDCKSAIDVNRNLLTPLCQDHNYRNGIDNLQGVTNDVI